jgi:hypothetical protein
MDPLSIGFAVVHVAKLATQLTLLMKKIVKAHAQVAKLLRDVQQFRHELDILARQVKHPQLLPHLPKDYIEQVLSDAEKALENLLLTLQKVSIEDGENLKVHKLSWVFYERRCREHHIRLAECLGKLKSLKDTVTL